MKKYEDEALEKKKCFGRMDKQPDRKVFTCLKCDLKKDCLSLSKENNPEIKENWSVYMEKAVKKLKEVARKRGLRLDAE